MVVVRASMGDGRVPGRASMSLVLDNGDIHHFFALRDGVHHSWTQHFRGRQDAAVQRELRRPNAEVVSHEIAGLWLLDGCEEEDADTALAS